MALIVDESHLSVTIVNVKFKEGEEDVVEHLSQVEGPSIPRAVGDDGGRASDGGRVAECVSVTHLGCSSMGFNHHLC